MLGHLPGFYPSLTPDPPWSCAYFSKPRAPGQAGACMHLEVTHELGQGRCCLHYSLWVCGAGGVGWVSSHLPVCLSMLDFLLPAITVSSCDRGLGSYLSGTHIVTNLSLSSKFVTHIWSGIPSSLLKVWPIKPRINHFSWSCRTSDSQGQSSPTLDMAQSQVS